MNTYSASILLYRISKKLNSIKYPIKYRNKIKDIDCTLIIPVPHPPDMLLIPLLALLTE